MKAILGIAALFSVALLVVGYVRVLSAPQLKVIEEKALAVYTRSAQLETTVKWKVSRKSWQEKQRGQRESRSRR